MLPLLLANQPAIAAITPRVRSTANALRLAAAKLHQMPERFRRFERRIFATPEAKLRGWVGRGDVRVQVSVGFITTIPGVVHAIGKADALVVSGTADAHLDDEAHVTSMLNASVSGNSWLLQGAAFVRAAKTQTRDAAPTTALKRYWHEIKRHCAGGFVIPFGALFGGAMSSHPLHETPYGSAIAPGLAGVLWGSNSKRQLVGAMVSPAGLIEAAWALIEQRLPRVVVGPVISLVISYPKQPVTDEAAETLDTLRRVAEVGEPK